MNDLTMDYLSGAEADNMDLTGSGRRRRRGRRRHRGGYAGPVILDSGYYDDAPDVVVIEADDDDADLEGAGKKKKKHKSLRAKKRWAAIHAARAKRAAAAQAAYGFDPQALFPGMAPGIEQGAAPTDAGQTFGQAMAGVPMPFMQQAARGPEGDLYEAIGGFGYDESEGGGPQGGARVLEYASFDDYGPTPMPQRPVEIDLDEEELDFEVEGGAGLPFMAAVMGSGCGCETYRRYPKRSGIQRPF